MDSSTSVEGVVKIQTMSCWILLQAFRAVQYFLCLWMFHSICFGNNLHDGLIQPSSFTDMETRWHGLSGVFHKINVLLSNICDILCWKKFMIYSSEWKYMPIISTLRLIYQESQSTNSIKLFISILPYPGKSQFSFQSQRKAMPKNVQTTTKLHSSHTLAKSCWKFSKPGFNSMWTVNFLQAGFRKGRGTRDQIANIPWIIEKAREFQKNIYFCFIGYAKAFDYVDHNKLWIILQEMGIPDHLICLLRNLYASKEATVRTVHGTTDWFQIRKGVHQGCILSPCLFNFYAECIMWNAGLDEA